MDGGSEVRMDSGSTPAHRSSSRQTKPVSRLDVSSEWSKRDIKKHDGTRHGRVRSEGESYSERGAARDEARAEAAALREERDTLKEQLELLRSRISDLVLEAHDTLDEPHLESATAVIAAEALHETIADLRVDEAVVGEADGPAHPSVMLGGELGTRVRLSLKDGALLCTGAGLNVSVRFDDISFVDDDDESGSVVLLVMSKTGEEKRFHFGNTGAAASVMDAFEQRLNAAMERHAAAKAAEQDAREQALEQAAAARTSRSETPVSSTRDSKLKRSGRELFSALTAISKLESAHANTAAKEKMAAVVAADAAHDPSQLTSEAARRQRESASKHARKLRDQLFAVGGLHQTRQTIECLLAMPCVALALGEGRVSVAKTRKEMTDAKTASVRAPSRARARLASCLPNTLSPPGCRTC